jgi:hypothetical protein
MNIRIVLTNGTYNDLKDVVLIRQIMFQDGMWYHITHGDRVTQYKCSDVDSIVITVVGCYE